MKFNKSELQDIKMSGAISSELELPCPLLQSSLWYPDI